MERSVLEQTLQALYTSDERIVQLLTLRRQLASQLARASLAQGLAYTPEARRTAILSRLQRGNPGPLDQAHLAAIFELVLRLTEPLPVGLSANNGVAKKG